MIKLLVVEASPRGGVSISRTITRRFVAEWQSNHPDGEIVRRDLMKTDLKFLTGPWIESYFTPGDVLSNEGKKLLALSTELTEELMATDHLVIGTPVHNYNVPAVLKAWVDHIVRKGMTLGFDGRGLLSGKKATVLMASGGVYTEGSPIRDRDVATQYLKMILSIIGITDVTVIAGGGAKVVDLGEQTMEEFVGKLEPEIKAAAA